eukprot:SAG31_NODE_16604_length_703_cov_0.561258_1_plen_44_part_01
MKPMKMRPYTKIYTYCSTLLLNHAVPSYRLLQQSPDAHVEEFKQ